MLDLIMSVVSGGATGLVGMLLSGVLSFFKERGERDHELKLRSLDIELAKAEASSAERVAAVEAESASEQAEMAALEASYREASARMSRPHDGFLLQLVDFVRGMTRPVLTWGLVGLVAWIYFSLSGELAVDELRNRIIQTVLYLATAAVLWWFGQRMVDGRGKKVYGLPWSK